MTEKTFAGYLIVDYRDDDLRFRKTRPSRGERSPSEYPLKVEVTAEVPEYDVPTLSADLNVPEAQVRAAATEDLLDDANRPEWHDLVDDGLEHFPNRVHEAKKDPQAVEFDDAVSTIVGYVLRNADGYPDPDEVEQAVENAIHDYGGSP
ncbi:hypothetical protein HrrHc1_190 [Halorubrum phage Hardycor1]|nr:hypothetical protein HrrHc1_190 [Halorubrum phage Hardycor1]